MKTAMNKKIALAAICISLLMNIETGAQKKPARPLFGYVVIPKVEKTITVLETILRSVNEQNFPPNSLKMQIGMNLGDPELANLDKTKPVVGMLFKPSQEQKPNQQVLSDGRRSDVTIAIFVPPVDKNKYLKAFSTMKVRTAFREGVLIIAPTDDALQAAETNFGLYQELAKNPPAADFRVFADIQTILSAYENQIAGLIANMESSMRNRNPEKKNIPQEQKTQQDIQMKFGLLYLSTAVELAKQLKNYQFDIDLSSDSVQFTTALAAKEETPLFNYYSMEWDGKLSLYGILPETDFFTLAAYYDFVRFGALIKKLIDTAGKKNPSFKETVTDELVSLYLQAFGYFAGEMAFSFGISAENRLSVKMLAKLKDPEKYFEYLEKWISSFQKSKAYADMKKMSGLSVSYKKKARIVQTFPVSSLSVKLNYEKIGSEQEAALMKQLLGETITFELASVKGVLIASSSMKDFNTLIEKAKSDSGGRKLEAITRFGNTMSTCADFDIYTYITKIFSLAASQSPETQTNDLKNLLGFAEALTSKLAGPERTVLYADRCEKGTSHARYYVPLKGLGEIGKYVSEKKKTAEPEVDEVR